MSKDQLHDRVEVEFNLKPVSEETGKALDALRAVFKETAHFVVDFCPESRELSLALTELDSSCRWAIAAIVR